MENTARKWNINRCEILPVSRKGQKQKQDLGDRISAIMSELVDIKHSGADSKCEEWRCSLHLYFPSAGVDTRIRHKKELPCNPFKSKHVSMIANHLEYSRLHSWLLFSKNVALL